MKVVKRTDVSKWSYKHICSNCDSELEVETKDLKHHYYDGDMREPGYDSFTAECAVCSQQFTIPSNKIPKLIQVEAKKKYPTGAGGYYR